MPELLPFIKNLCSLPGLSGWEEPAARLIEERWRPLVDQVSLSRVGSLHGLKRGTGPEPRPAIMLSAHMDAIGLMVSGVVDGFLRVSSVGGVDPRTLPGQLVNVHASGGGEAETSSLPGIIAQPGSRLLPPETNDGTVPLEYLLVDVGLPAEKVKVLIKVGDLVSFASEPLDLAGGALAAHTLDNRVSVAALTVCLEELQGRPHAWDAWAVASVQEETGLTGAYTSTYQLAPSLVIAVDVTFAKGPGSSDWQTVPLGEGPGLCMGPNIHPKVHKALKEQAEKLEIPFTLEYAPRHTGTDTFAAQVTAEGVPAALIGIPLRYMHTPVEVVVLKDIQRAGRLMAEFIASLTPESLQTFAWEK